MFVTDKLIYLQMQKTGSTHIASLLSKCVGGTQKKKHQCLQDYGTKKFIVGSVRNPWEWYVSLWAFGCGNRGDLHYRLTKRNLWRVLSRFVRLKYTLKYEDIRHELTKPVGLWRMAYQDYRNPECFRIWLKLIYAPQRKKDLGEGYPECSISEFAGIMTYRYCKVHMRDFLLGENQKILKDIDSLREFDKTHNILDFTIRNESLEDEVVRALQLVGYNINEKTINLIYNSAGDKTFKSKHYEPSFYYDEETINLVAEKEKLIIEKYSYTQP